PVAAASDAGVWIATVVMPDEPAHIHGDVRDLVVARVVRLDGTVGDERPVISWRDPHEGASSSNEASRSAENIKLSAAALAGDELVLAGTAMPGAIADGTWQTSTTGLAMEGFVLAVPTTGPVRAVATSGDTVFEDVAVAGHRYVAAGWCS